MYLISNEAFDELLNGEFCQVLIAKTINPDISVTELYNYQFKYDNYDSFRKFYRKHLEPIINKVRYIKDDTIQGGILKGIYFNADKQ